MVQILAAIVSTFVAVATLAMIVAMLRRDWVRISVILSGREFACASSAVPAPRVRVRTRTRNQFQRLAPSRAAAA